MPEAKGLPSSGLAGVSVLSPKLLEAAAVPEEGLRGTSWMAAHTSSRPELSLAEVAVPMETAEDIMRVFSCLPRPWLPAVVMGHPLAENLWHADGH